MLPPSGEQFLLSSGGAAAIVTEVGATLRDLAIAGEEVVLPFAEDEIAGDGRGQLLSPWPNRLGDGRYRFGGRDGVVPLNEPERGNAIHGLLRWQAFRPVEQRASAVRLESVLEPQPAYPWRLRLSVEYRLSEEALSVTVLAVNESDDAAPFGYGFHPYLRAPRGADRAGVALGAARHLLLDERGLPSGEEEMADWPDAVLFNGDDAIGAAAFDDCLYRLARGADGWAEVTFLPVYGANRRVRLRLDAAFDYLMIYTADHLAGDERRQAIAIEPMTCAPDAFRSGRGLVRLEPQAEFRAAFSIAAEGASERG